MESLYCGHHWDRLKCSDYKEVSGSLPTSEVVCTLKLLAYWDSINSAESVMIIEDRSDRILKCPD